MEVPDGKIVTLIGANGAGKSTTLRTITGLVKPAQGSIHFQWNGKDITGHDATTRSSGKGIAIVPEGRRVFADLTVLENLKIGAYLRKDKEGIQKDIEWVYYLVPPPAGAELAGCRHPVRRRAADAGRWACPHEPPQADDDG